MAPVKETILILDDEPHLLDWLIEYLEAQSYEICVAKDIAEAQCSLNSGVKFRMMILDLNVPSPGEFTEILKEKGELHQTYRGLYVAELARNMGYRGPQVVVYSVHDIETVRDFTNRIGVHYVTKGRPRAFKEVVNNVLSYDPTATKS